MNQESPVSDEIEQAATPVEQPNPRIAELEQQVARLQVAIGKLQEQRNNALDAAVNLHIELAELRR